ncbi:MULTISPECIES: histidinol dehydrogenase [Micrococcaceae]|uniref:histidinol dehydrogenase n=1 Tax=unclassified Kocuria TaxID=2649579 RepID=UPI001011BB83|nr:MULTISPECIES: histidinol dehydrogenase [unclassified Kocuria]
MRVLDLRGKQLSHAQLLSVVPRQTSEFVSSAADSVASILADVKDRGSEALRELSERFDGVEQTNLRVPQSAIDRAVEELDPSVRRGLETAIERTRVFAGAQRPEDASIEVAPGARLVHRWTPVRRVGLYVPGGLAVYPSSVVMNAVPAQAAGVDSVVLCTPPQREFGGLPHPTTLAAAGLLGIDEVWAIGGAQALGAMAYGFDGEETLEPVDTVTGPGNIFVAMAKRQLRSVVGVDGEAGTTEIAVIADAQANPDYVAADLLSQAEHDPHAGSILITDSPELADQTSSALQTRVAKTKHHDRVVTALTGPQSGVILTEDVEQSIDVANAYAPEHLEIQTDRPGDIAARIRNAGAIFLGPYSPVPLGDYAAGSNHVLPTGGSARHSSGLCTTSFMKAVQIIEYSADALAEVGEDVVALSGAEDLPAHGEAITARIDDSASEGVS